MSGKTYLNRACSGGVERYNRSNCLFFGGLKTFTIIMNSRTCWKVNINKNVFQLFYAVILLRGMFYLKIFCSCSLFTFIRQAVLSSCMGLRKATMNKTWKSNKPSRCSLHSCEKLTFFYKFTHPVYYIYSSWLAYEVLGSYISSWVIQLCKVTLIQKYANIVRLFCKNNEFFSQIISDLPTAVYWT